MLRQPAISGLSAMVAFVSGAALQPAAAWEAETVAERYKTLMEIQGVDVSWSAVERVDDSIAFADLQYRLEGIDEPIDLGALTFEAVSEGETDYRIGRIAVDTLTHGEGKVEIAVSDVEVNDMILPKAGDGDTYGGMPHYGRFTMAELTATMGGEEPVFVLENVSATTEPAADAEGTLASDATAERFWLDLARIVDSKKAKAVLSEFGYEQLSGRVEMAGTWRPGDGRAVLSRYDTTIDDAGTLGMTLDLSGYTPEFMRTLQETQEKMENAGEEQRQAQGLAMLGLMQQLNLHGATLRFDDASLTGKIVSYVAEKQGAEPGDVVNQAKAVVPLMAGQYLGQELAQSVGAALGTFLDDPRNLEVRLAPSEPLPVAALLGALQSPETLVEQLEPQVTANQ